MSLLAIIVVSAQISPNHYQISAHHGSEDGQRRAADTLTELAPISRSVRWRRVEPKPIPQG